MSTTKTSKGPRPLTLESIEDELQWARAFMKAQRDARIGYDELTPEQRAIHWIIRELLRIEVLLIARSGDPALVDRLAETREQLRKLEGYNDHDDGVMDGVAQVIQRWAERAPGDCDAVLAFASRSSWWTLRWAAAQALRVDHPPSLALLQQLARDADDSIKRAAAERLAARQELPLWSVAFSSDPLPRVPERKRKALSKAIAAVCDAFRAPDGWELTEQRDKRRAAGQKRYKSALEALPDELLLDHAQLVLSATGQLDGRHQLVLGAIGARDKSLPLLHLALDREDARYRVEALQSLYFARHEERSRKDRADATLAHLRWLTKKAAANDGWRWALPARQLQWTALWPARTAMRPLYEQIVASCAADDANVVHVVIEQVGFAKMPADLRDQLLDDWESGAHTHEELGFDPELLADTVPPKQRWARAQSILRGRRSTEAMQWALRAWSGPLYDAKRDGERAALVARWCEDPGLRAAILADPMLSLRCVEPLRALFGRGAITRRAELGAVVSAIGAVSLQMEWRDYWWELSHGGRPRTAVRSAPRNDALPYCADRAALEPLSDDEWSRVRTLRHHALRERGSALTRDDRDLFPTSAWTAEDIEDFREYAEQAIAESEGYDLAFLCTMVLTQWTDALRPQAERLLAALDESMLEDIERWQKLLKDALAGA